MIAVGTYAEAPVALAAFPGDVLVMEPYRPVIDALPHLGEGALVHTITHGPDLDDLAGRVGRPRVVVEGLLDEPPGSRPTGCSRPSALAPCNLLGLSLHLPRGGSRRRGAPLGRPVRRPGAALPRDPGRAGRAPAAYPDHTFRVRIGTQLWLGDPRPAASRATSSTSGTCRPATGPATAASGCGPAGSSWCRAVPLRASRWRRPVAPTPCGTGRSPSRKAPSRPLAGSGRRSGSTVTRRGSWSHRTCRSASSCCPREHPS